MSCSPGTAPQLLVDGQSARHIDGFASHAAGLREAAGVEIADDDARGAKELCAGGGGKANGACARDVDGGPRGNASLDAAVIAGGQDVAEEGKVLEGGRLMLDCSSAS